MATDEELAEDFIKVRLFNRYGSFLTPIKEIAMSTPIEIVQVEGNYDRRWPCPTVYLLLVNIAGLRSVFLWPFYALNADSSLIHLLHAIDNLPIAFAHMATEHGESDRFLDVRQSLKKCKEKVGLETLAPPIHSIPLNSGLMLDRIRLDYFTKDNYNSISTQRAKYLSWFRDDDSEIREGPEELSYLTPLSIIADICQFINEFDYTNVSKNSTFITKYTNLLYALKILQSIEENDLASLMFCDSVDLAVTLTNESEGLSPASLYELFYEINNNPVE